jgi:hypothetical protein
VLGGNLFIALGGGAIVGLFSRGHTGGVGSPSASWQELCSFPGSRWRGEVY